MFFMSTSANPSTARRFFDTMRCIVKDVFGRKVLAVVERDALLQADRPNGGVMVRR